MAQGVNSPDGVNMLNANKDVDLRKQPIYESRDALLAALPVSKRAIGLTMDYIESGNWVTGRFVGGTADADFEEVEMGGTLADTLTRGNSANGSRISNLGDPLSNKDAVNKEYVDTNFLFQIITDESLHYDPSSKELRTNIAQLTETFVFGGSKLFTLLQNSVDVVDVFVNRSNKLFLFDDYTLTAINEIEISENFPLQNGDLIRIKYNYIIN